MKEIAIGILGAVVGMAAVSAPVKSNVAGNEIGRNGAPLPYDAEVEYIESTGRQWIDTGLKSYKSSTASNLKITKFIARMAAMSNGSSMFHGWNGWGFWGASNGKFVMYRETAESVPFTIGKFYDFEVLFSPASVVLRVDGGVVRGGAGQGNSNAYGIGIFCIGNANGTVTGNYSGLNFWRIEKMYVESVGEVRDMISVRFTNEAG